MWYSMNYPIDYQHFMTIIVSFIPVLFKEKNFLK